MIAAASRAASAPCGARQARQLVRRDAILAIAEQSFLTRGYAGTSMSAIAAILGGSKTTLWSYFPSKAALFEAALGQAIAMHHALLSESLDPCGDLRLTLKRFATNFIRIVTLPNSIALHRLVQGEAGRFPEVGEIFYRHVPRRTKDLLGDFFASAMQRGLMRDADPLAAASILVSLCMSGSYQELMLGLRGQPTSKVIEQDADRAVEAFMRAYGATNA